MAWASAWVFLDITNPLVAWLVYRGEIVSLSEAHRRALSFWTTEYLRANSEDQDGTPAERFETERVLEELRQADYPDAVSRLKAFYAFPDKDTAVSAAGRWGIFKMDSLAEIGLRPDVRVSRFDAEWISHNLGSAARDWMHWYLQGKASSGTPIWELVIDGRALVFGTDLRERAYKVVRATWPDSLALLELARVAVELDSDLGLIVAMVTGDGAGGFRVRYAMNFEDANDDAFLKRFSTFEGPRNTKDLTPTSQLVLPDLRPNEFSLR